MALTLGDNFSYQGAKPLDARLRYDTLATMKAVADATMYDGCMAYCVATDKTYQWKSTNTVDASTGRWREFSSGGSGGTTDYTDLTNKPSINGNELSGNKTSAQLGLQDVMQYSTLPTPSADWVGKIVQITKHSAYTQDPFQGNSYECVGIGNDQYEWRNTAYLALNRDVNISSPTNGQFLGYNSSTGKWGNVANPTSNCYSTTDTTFTDLADGDYVPVYDTSATIKKRTLLSNLHAWLKAKLFNINACTHYGTCSTVISTANKEVIVQDIAGLTLQAGMKVVVKFTNGNTSTDPYLQLYYGGNATSGKAIKYIASDGTVTTPTSWWGAGDVVTFVYDGTQFLMQPTLSMGGSGGTLVGHIGRSDIHTTTERVVGTWVDGRPIYQKSWNITATKTMVSGQIDLTSIIGLSSGINEIVDCVAVGTATATGQKHMFLWMRALYVSGSNVTDEKVGIIARANADGSTLVCLISGSTSATTSYKDIRITLQYTKTSDAANSYNLSDANDYSTTEKVVGTWIDGKKLYQKTISCGAMPNNTVKNVSHGISGISRIVDVRGYCWSTSQGNYGLPLPYTAQGGGNNAIQVFVNLSQITLASQANMSDYTESYVTLRYTKTTG